MTCSSAVSVAAQAPFDAALAAKLKADDLGMRTYVVAFLKAGPNRERPAGTILRRFVRQSDQREEQEPRKQGRETGGLVHPPRDQAASGRGKRKDRSS